MRQSGSLKKLKDQAWPLTSPSSENLKFVEVTIEGVFPVHFLLSMGIVLSLMIFIFEINCPKGVKKNTKNMYGRDFSSERTLIERLNHKAINFTPKDSYRRYDKCVIK